MQAPPNNFLGFARDFLQSRPLSRRQFHSPNLHVLSKLPNSLPATRRFSHPPTKNAMPIANRKVRFDPVLNPTDLVILPAFR